MEQLLTLEDEEMSTTELYCGLQTQINVKPKNRQKHSETYVIAVDSDSDH